VTLHSEVGADPSGIAGLCDNNSAISYDRGECVEGDGSPFSECGDGTEYLFCDGPEIFVQPVSGVLERSVTYWYPDAARPATEYYPVVADAAGGGPSFDLEVFASPGVAYRRTNIPAALDPLDGVDRDCDADPLDN